jgi:hypothetical protein
MSLGRWWGVAMRVHVILPMWAIAELVGWVSVKNIGLVHAVSMTAAFLLVVVYRELGRAAASRALGANLDEVELWPLGGLSLSTGGGVRPGVLSELGGVMAGAVALPLLAAGVILSGAGGDALVFHPLLPGVTAGGLRTVPQVVVWWLYYANATVLLANALVPMASFDCGRVLGVKIGRERAAQIGLLVGFAAFVAAASLGLSRVVAGAMIGLVASWVELQRGANVGRVLPLEASVSEDALAMVDDVVPTPGMAAPFEVSLDDVDGLGEFGEESEMDAVEDLEADVEEPTLDEVLAKITRTGMGSLNAIDCRVLERETMLRRRHDEVTPKDGDFVAAE